VNKRSALGEVTPYITKDGSEIRELLHPEKHAVRRQSLAEAVVPPGGATQLHRHEISEEMIYHVTRGRGLMTLGSEQFAIAPGTPHRVENTSGEALHILCCCAPAYSHDDTILL